MIGSLESVDAVEMIDKVLKKKIILKANKPFRLHYFQLQTLSQSEQGFDLSVQGLSIAMVFDFESSLTLEGSLEITRV